MWGPSAVTIGSRMLMSMTCPRPVRSRSRSAISTAPTVAMPQIESARPKGGRVGGPSASPVMWAKPLIASISVPKPGCGA
jgi:hypothetical protein